MSSDFRADELERTCKKASLSKTAYHFFPSLKILSSPGGFEREGCKTGRLLEIESRPYTHGYILVALSLQMPHFFKHQHHHHWPHRLDGALVGEHGDDCNNASFTQLATYTQTSRHTQTNIHRSD